MLSLISNSQYVQRILIPQARRDGVEPVPMVGGTRGFMVPSDSRCILACQPGDGERPRKDYSPTPFAHHHRVSGCGPDSKTRRSRLASLGGKSHFDWIFSF
jgi:hypothetical protein